MDRKEAKGVLKKTRLFKRISLRKMAEDTGLCVNTIIAVENLEKNCTVKSIMKCADALGVEISEVIKDYIF